MSNAIEQNEKNKLAIIISVITHIVLFVIFIWYSRDEYINDSASDKGGIVFKAITVDIEDLMQNYNRQQNAVSKLTTKQNKKQIQQQLYGRRERHTMTKVAKISSESKTKSNVKVRKEVMETAKKAIQKTEKKTIIPNVDINTLFNDLSSSKNTPNTSSIRGKENKVSLDSSFNIMNKDHLNMGINQYANQIKSAIENHFYDASSYAGKICKLRIKLAPDGMLVDIKSEGGDSALCSAALSAARRAQMPKPPSQEIYKIFENIPLDFKP